MIVKRRKARKRHETTDDHVAWPHLGFEQVGSLDYSVPQIDADWLRDVGTRAQKGGKEGPTPIERTCGDLLLRLAELPTAITELNHATDRAPQHVRALNLAVHYLAQTELLGEGHSKQARGEVAQAWAMKDSAVKDCCSRDRLAEAAKEIDWLVRLVLARDLALKQPKGLKREDVLRLLIQDMKVRAGHTAMRPRRQRKVKRRK